MKTCKWIVVIALCGAVSSSAAAINEFRIGGAGLVPSGDFWEPGGGASIEWRATSQNNFVFGLSLGVLQVDANDEELPGDEGFVYSRTIQGLKYYGFVHYYEGDATIIPINGLIGYVIPIGKATLSLEGGVKYIFVNADVTAHMLDGITYAGYVLDADTWTSDTEIGGNLLGFCGANVTMPLNKEIGLFVEAGYQFDITKSDVEFKTHYTGYDGRSVTESELAGAYLQGGLVWSWPVPKAGSGARHPEISAVQHEERQLTEEREITDAKKTAAEREAAERKEKALDEEPKTKDKRQPKSSKKDPSEAMASTDEAVTSLKQLKNLRDEGILTEDEYETRRKVLVNQLIENE